MKTLSLLGLALAAYSTAGGATIGSGSPPPRRAPPVATITAHDYYYDPIANVPSGVVELRLHNAGSDIHNVTLLKLGPGKTSAELVAALKTQGMPPAWAEFIPSPNAPAPGEGSNVIVALKPGNYIVLCFVTTGGTPHFMKGMYRAFKVVRSNNHATEPAPDAHFEMFDYNFRLSKPVSAGNHIFHVMNTGSQPHEMQLFQLAPGKTVGDIANWLGGDMKSAPPGKPMGGMDVVLPHSHAEFRAHMDAGEWAAICFVPDAKTGKPHFLQGMQYQFTVQ